MVTNGVVAIQQAAAIPVRQSRICLVTSRNGKRWVLPKGCLEPNKSAGQIALVEAWEEAGLVGVLHPDPVGAYLYEKLGNLYHVVVFHLSVTRAADEWPEMHMRQRIWVPMDKAGSRLSDLGVAELVQAVSAKAQRDAALNSP
jgi:8-oxo-dGTP pyrophosphatase MutT (NUDIX family)